MQKLIVASFYLIMIPLTGIFTLTGIYTVIKNRSFHAFILLLVIWLQFYFGSQVLLELDIYLNPMIVTMDDIRGEYVIDKERWPGKQADWQYDHFRFEINANDQMLFQSRRYDDIWHTDTINVSYSSGYYSLERKEYCNRKLRVHPDSSDSHIMQDNPTLYRKRFEQFYYVFESEKFGNVFFKRGEWSE